MIEHVSNIITTLAQLAYILWPLFIVTAFAYSFQGIGGKRWLKNLGHRIQKNLVFTWTFLFVIWIITFFAEGDTPSLLPEPFNTIIFLLGFVIVVVLEINRLRLVPPRILARIDMYETQAVIHLRKMDPSHFEELVAETYRTLGHEAFRTGQRGDHGIDVEILTSSGERWIIQCKRYRDSVGEGIVRELYGTLISEHADRAILVTSADITPPAEKWAKGKPIDLVDGRKFLKLIELGRRKAQGSLFDRIISWFINKKQANSIPTGLRQKANIKIDDQFEITRPARVNATADGLLMDFPICPHCGNRTIIHPNRPGRKLFRCINYPKCRVVIESK